MLLINRCSSDTISSICRFLRRKWWMGNKKKIFHSNYFGHRAKNSISVAFWVRLSLFSVCFTVFNSKIKLSLSLCACVCQNFSPNFRCCWPLDDDLRDSDDERRNKQNVIKFLFSFQETVSKRCQTAEFLFFRFSSSSSSSSSMVFGKFDYSICFRYCT